MSHAIQHPANEVDPEWIRIVREKVETLRYGVVQLVVHDGRVMQIERTEKTRLAQRGTSQDSAAL